METKDSKHSTIISASSEDTNKTNSASDEKYLKTKKNTGFKTKECSVIGYNNITNTLDVNFDGYGVRISNVENFDGSIVAIKYKGEIGKPNFYCEL